MSKDPAFLFYPNDYIGGTMGMTFEEKGAYIELLMLQFNRGHMTSQMIGQTVGQLWVKIQDKFIKDNDGLYFNARLELEIKKRQTFVNSRYNNLSGKNQYTKDEGHTDGHMTSRMENEDVIVNEDIINNKPTVEEFIEYFKINGYSKDSAITAFNWYDTHNWCDRNGDPVKNWKNKVRQVWFKESNLIPKQKMP